MTSSFTSSPTPRGASEALAWGEVEEAYSELLQAQKYYSAVLGEVVATLLWRDFGVRGKEVTLWAHYDGPRSKITFIAHDLPLEASSPFLPLPTINAIEQAVEARLSPEVIEAFPRLRVAIFQDCFQVEGCEVLPFA